MRQRPNTIEDFWRNVDVRGDDECWEWKRSRRKEGYGQIRIQGKMWKTHRLALSTVQDVPDGMCVLHKCDNPPCCNPAHLLVGTHDDNVRDMVQKNRQRAAIGEANGSSKLTEAIVQFIKQSTLPQWRLAEIFGVKQPAISKIKSGKRWKHVSLPTARCG